MTGPRRDPRPRRLQGRPRQEPRRRSAASRWWPAPCAACLAARLVTDVVVSTDDRGHRRRRPRRRRRGRRCGPPPSPATPRPARPPSCTPWTPTRRLHGVTGRRGPPRPVHQPVHQPARTSTAWPPPSSSTARPTRPSPSPRSTASSGGTARPSAGVHGSRGGQPPDTGRYGVNHDSPSAPPPGPAAGPAGDRRRLRHGRRRLPRARHRFFGRTARRTDPARVLEIDDPHDLARARRSPALRPTPRAPTAPTSTRSSSTSTAPRPTTGCYRRRGRESSPSTAVTASASRPAQAA